MKLRMYFYIYTEEKIKYVGNQLALTTKLAFFGNYIGCLDKHIFTYFHITGNNERYPQLSFKRGFVQFNLNSQSISFLNKKTKKLLVYLLFCFKQIQLGNSKCLRLPDDLYIDIFNYLFSFNYDVCDGI